MRRMATVAVALLVTQRRFPATAFQFTNRVSSFRTSSFNQINKNGVKFVSHASRLSTIRNPGLQRLNVAADSSAEMKSRAPFSSPKNSFDDSITSDPSLLNDLSWSRLGLIDELVAGLTKGMELTDPTPVQRMAIPAIMGNSEDGAPQSVAFAAATGSGKTLAYLLPIIQSLKAEELLSTENVAAVRRPKRPRAIILAPTRELASQILAVLKQLSHHCKISSVGIIGGEDYGKQRKMLEKPIDVVVASPGRLVRHRDAGHVYMSSVRHCVIDEVDSMLEQGFQQDIAKIIHPLLYKRTGTIPEGTQLVEAAPQIVLTSATITPSVRRLLEGKGKKVRNKNAPDGENEVAIRLPPGMRMLEAPGLHRAVPRLRQVFVDVGATDKLTLLIDVVVGGGEGAAILSKDRISDRSSGKSRALTLVFCNTVASARAAEYALAEAGVNTLCYHGELGSSDRAANLEKFRSAEDKCNVLVATDIAARGLDVPEVDHVVMFDFPLNPIDYLHRAGRTARGVNQRQSSGANSRAGNGRVTALVAKRDQVLAKAIEGAVQRGEPLDGLSSRKTDYLPGGKLGNRKFGTKKNNNKGQKQSKRFNLDDSSARRRRRR
mmetsp:Transcript_8362/g.12387  ORF Transcript_8362/g.12387 Transcript_8362/m.12387 type:complete len:604 (+) Transcript_8362:55-1866(+)